MKFKDLKGFHKAVERVQIIDCKDLLFVKEWFCMFSSVEFCSKDLVIN